MEKEIALVSKSLSDVATPESLVALNFADTTLLTKSSERLRIEHHSGLSWKKSLLLPGWGQVGQFNIIASF